MLGDLLRLFRKQPQPQPPAEPRGPHYIINGHFSAPYFIFLRQAGRLTDSAVLGLLGAENYQRIPDADFLGTQHVICIAEDAEWFHIMDDWRYTLWHRRPAVADQICALLPGAEIFACSVGDADDSFDFEWRSGGKLLRRYAVSDPHYCSAKRVITETIGAPLEAEISLAMLTRQKTDVTEYVLSLARSLGIDTRHNLDAIRCYRGNEPSP